LNYYGVFLSQHAPTRSSHRTLAAAELEMVTSARYYAALRIDEFNGASRA
jgi:hypothetical protein